MKKLYIDEDIRDCNGKIIFTESHSYIVTLREVLSGLVEWQDGRTFEIEDFLTECLNLHDEYIIIIGEKK